MTQSPGRLRLSIVLGSILFGSLGPAAALNFRDGRWHVTVVTEIRGMNMKPPGTYDYERCFSKEDLLPELAPPNAPCRALRMRETEDELTWRLLCNPSLGDFSGRGAMRFHGDRMEGQVNTFSSYPESMEVIQRLSGKRVGDCKPRPGKRIEPARPKSGLKDYEEKR